MLEKKETGVVFVSCAKFDRREFTIRVQVYTTFDGIVNTHFSSFDFVGFGTQEDLMKQDTCILVDENDEILGHGSKQDCHR